MTRPGCAVAPAAVDTQSPLLCCSRSTATRLVPASRSLHERTVCLLLLCPCRVVDYFLVVGHGTDLRPVANEDDGGGESDELSGGGGAALQQKGSRGSLTGPLPVKRSFLTRLYAGEVMARFPATDHRSVPFPEGIAMFCIPDSIRLSTSLSDLPCLYSFAATQANGHRLYGACLQFWEAVPPHIIDPPPPADR